MGIPSRGPTTKNPAIKSVDDVVAHQLCCGCGACAYADPHAIEMIDTLDHGRRPRTRPSAAPDHESGLAVCPGVELSHQEHDPRTIEELRSGWGPVLELWEGYATDPEIRYRGSSGGAASALALWAMEKGDHHGTLHINARKDTPYLNETVLSTTREEIVAATGSRYAPASPCDGLAKVEAAPSPCVILGKPCDVAATAKAARLRPELDSKVGFTVAIFCAGTPSTQGTLEMMRQMGIENPEDVLSVRYRGNGWPGMATVEARDEEGDVRSSQLTYAQSWGDILQKHRPWRCYICADHTGEFADIAVGDPWYREIPDDEPGRSLILARTERGRRILQAARDAGYLDIEPVPSHILPDSQPNILNTRGAIWARLWAARLAGLAIPRYRRLPTFRFWLGTLPFARKFRTFLGTFKWIAKWRLRDRLEVEEYTPEGPRAKEELRS